MKSLLRPGPAIGLAIVDTGTFENFNKESVLGRGRMRRLSLNFVLFDNADSV
jgi:hypothetical protein